MTSTSPSAADRQLRHLARAYRLQTIYTDGRGQRRHASRESVLATLQALGAPVATPEDAADAGRTRDTERWSRPIEPVVVAWQGRGHFVVRLPSARAATRVSCHLRLEDGTALTWVVSPADDPATRTVDVDGARYVCSRHALPSRLPHGYHELRVDGGSQTFTAVVISAPLRAFESHSTTWGCFLPLHALHTKRSWGLGDFSDLAALVQWTSSEGGQVVSTLPLLASFLGEAPFEPSPYLPVSRLFWNEAFVDPREVPEFADCTAARRLVESSVFRKEIAALRRAPLVDYRRAMVAKRQVLDLLAGSLTRRRGRRHHELEQWTQQRPLATEYATFRATGERLGQPWSLWPHRLTPETLRNTRADRAAVRYHLYVQWVAETQINRVVAHAHTAGRGLYLDFPLGVHPEGFDVWRYPGLFARDAETGAPPDELFVNGQNWTAPPPHPETARDEGYRYLRNGLARQLEKSGALRLDHVMALHRLYWIPRGFESTDGVYVHYPADELYAIVCLESHRHRTPVIGENLGTVPRDVNRTMARHGLGQLYVAQFNVTERLRRPLRPVPAGALACVNTHDTPTFKGFIEGADIDERVSRGVVGASEARQAHRRRRAAVAALARLPRGAIAGKRPSEPLGMLQDCLAQMARSRASLVIVNLEDLWLEPRPQNVPGTDRERPNWQRKARHSLEALTALPEVSETLQRVARARAVRQRGRPQPR